MRHPNLSARSSVARPAFVRLFAARVTPFRIYASAFFGRRSFPSVGVVVLALAIAAPNASAFGLATPFIASTSSATQAPPTRNPRPSPLPTGLSGLKKTKTKPRRTRTKQRVRIIQSKTEVASSALTTGRYQNAARALDDALLMTRDLAPLVVSKVVVVASKPTALGVYRPADHGTIRDRSLQLYVEVENFKHTPLQTDVGTDALYEVHLDVTGVFFLEDGQELGQKSLGVHRYETRTRTGRTWVGLDVQLGEAVPSGTYTIQIDVNDRASEKKSSRRVTFKIP